MSEVEKTSNTGFSVNRIADHLRNEIILGKYALGVLGNLTALADAMNTAGVETSTGQGKWQGVTVRRVLDRIDCMNEVASK